MILDYGHKITKKNQYIQQKHIHFELYVKNKVKNLQESQKSINFAA